MKKKPAKISLDSIIDEVIRDKNRLLSRYLDPYSLGNGQFQILIEVVWNEGISQEGIARKRKIDKSAVAKSVKKLIENGYIHKVRDETDKRAFCLYCTEKGRKMIPIIRDIIREVDSLLVKGFDAGEVDLFRGICLRMSQNIMKSLQDNRKVGQSAPEHGCRPNVR